MRIHLNHSANSSNDYCCSLLIIITLALLSTTAFTTSLVYADDTTSVVDDINITVNSSCTFSSGGGSYAEEVTNDNTTEISANTINTFCNDASGYSIYAIGYSGDTYTGGDNNKMLASAGSTYNIATNTSGDDSYWAMKIAKGTASASDTNLSITNSFDNYHTVPSTYTEIVKYSSTTAATGASINPTYKIYISSTQSAGTYEGKVKYVLVHPNTMTAGIYSIAYNANGGTGVMASDTGLNNLEEQTLKASTFTAPSGYTFAGWCTVQNQTQNPQTTCSGTTYTNQSTIPASTVTGGGTLSLYAMWGPLSTMQQFAAGTASTTCSTMSVGDIIILIDSRDQTEYTVGKLADQKCWMLDNLALDLVAKIDDLNENNTNASNATLNYLKNGGGSRPYTSAAVAYANSTDTFITPQIAVSGNCDDAYCVNDPESNKWTSSSVTQETIDGITSTAQGRIGVYYNYCAASAGSYCYPYDISSGKNASEDICPAGWHLPTGGINGEFGKLYGKYSSGSPSQAVAFQAALNMPLSGYFFLGVAHNQGYNGHLWSSTYNSSYGMYRLFVNSSNVNPSSNAYRDYGLSVRCLLSS